MKEKKAGKKRCPKCNSLFFYFRIRTNDFVCRNCGNIFAKPVLNSEVEEENKETEKKEG